MFAGVPCIRHAGNGFKPFPTDGETIVVRATRGL
jgi:hypothetical protein